MGRPSSRTRAGMMRKPPPTPNRPVRKPTAMPEAMLLGRQPRQLTPPPGSAQSPPPSPLGRSMRMPAATMTAAKPSSTSCSGSSRLTAAPAKAASMPAAPKTSAMRQRIWPPRRRGSRAVAEEMPDDEQAGRDGAGERFARAVDQGRDGQDGAAAAEQSEQDADDEPEGDDDGHAALLTGRAGRRRRTWWVQRPRGCRAVARAWTPSRSCWSTALKVSPAPTAMGTRDRRRGRRGWRARR